LPTIDNQVGQPASSPSFPPAFPNNVREGFAGAASFGSGPVG